MSLLPLLLLLQIKHLVIDFLWQPEYEWRNKGTLFHFGGIRHSAKHAIFTFFILLYPTSVLEAVVLVVIEFFAHYVIDYSKMNLNARYSLTPMNEKYWWLLGIDQFLHQLTYIIILYFL